MDSEGAEIDDFQKETTAFSINDQAAAIAQKMASRAGNLSIQYTRLKNGAHLIDAGIQSIGSLEAGRYLSKICLSGLGEVEFTRLEYGGLYLPGVTVQVCRSAVSCMASQYAGWALSVSKASHENPSLHDEGDEEDKKNNKNDFFAMASGPARALYAKEPLFKEIDYCEESETAVLVLETRTLPDESVSRAVAEKCGVSEDCVWLIAAPTASLAGSVQIAARVVETGMHKMHELGFDINCVVSGFGTCPIATIAKDDLAAIGRTNDTVLYAGQVWYTVDTDDGAIEKMIEKMPSSASKDFGTSFAEIFKRYDHDFYQIDPMLFSPAQVIINNMKSGRNFCAGKIDPDLIREIIILG